jgi:diguanylate cyclase (GGDEF)-like protein/PAS domain S-box-containing protein
VLAQTYNVFVLLNQGPTLRLIAGTEEDLLHAFLEHVPDGVYFKDRSSRFVRISRSLAARFGLGEPSLAIHKTDFDMFSPEHAQHALADEQHIIATGQPVVEKEERESWPDGRESWVLTTKLPLFDKEGNIVGTMGISRDITERKRVEQELEDYRAHLEELVAKRTAELVCANELLERDVTARKATELSLAIKAQELASANRELENLSLIDDLTGLYNRRGFMALAEHRVKLAYRNGAIFSVAFIDLDGLKQINDAQGHQAGNQALIDAAHVLKNCFRESDILARLGGDEFALFIAEADHKEITGRMQRNLQICNGEPGRHYQLSFSMGIVLGNAEKNLDITALLESADCLMYQQKRNKRCSRRVVDES